MNKNKNIPRLRFLEFKNSPEWEELPLDKLGKIISGLTYAPEDVKAEGLLVLRSSNVQNNKLVLNDNVYVRKDIDGVNLVHQDDILICVRNGSKDLIGKNALIPDKMPLCTHGAFMTIFRAKKPQFVFQLFQTKNYENQVNADLGATINSINSKNLIKYKFNTPKEKEQEKIAECLSSVDELITAQTDKIAALKEHKKGLMQKLFPQEDETTPRYRFLEFRNSPSWTDAPLGDIAVFFKGKNISKSDVVVDGMTECIRYGELYTHYKETIKEICSKTNLDKSTLIFSEYNDIIIPASGETQIDIATASCVLKKGVALGGDLNIIRSPLNGTFLSYYLNAIKKGEIAALAQGNSVVHLYISQLQKLIITYPELVEQEKIAECLSSLDELISLHTEKLSALKEHKKGLMQQLFPAVEKE